jgi:hypothetical protein
MAVVGSSPELCCSNVFDFHASRREFSDWLLRHAFNVASLELQTFLQETFRAVYQPV